MTKSHEKGPDISDVSDKALGKEGKADSHEKASDLPPTSAHTPVRERATPIPTPTPVVEEPVKPVPLNVPYERKLIPGEPEDNVTPKVADPRVYEDGKAEADAIIADERAKQAAEKDKK